MSELPYTISFGNPDDPLLLCLHGIGSCADAFIDQAPLAERLGRYVVAWDAPGYRHSPDPVTPYRLDDWADDAARIIEALGHDGGADLLGVSWGGVTSTRVALRRPELVRTLILADSSVGSGTSERNATAMRGRADAVTELGLDEFARSRAPMLFGEDAPQSVIDLSAKYMVDSVRMPVYQWACNSMAEADHTELLPTLEMPSLVIVGDQDRITAPKLSQRLADGLANSQLVTIAGAGHLANQEQPAAFNDAVAHFLG